MTDLSLVFEVRGSTMTKGNCCEERSDSPDRIADNAQQNEGIGAYPQLEANGGRANWKRRVMSGSFHVTYTH